MFKQIKKQFIDGLNEQTWMDYSTRAHARLKVGYTNELNITGFHQGNVQ